MTTNALKTKYIVIKPKHFIKRIYLFIFLIVSFHANNHHG